jgi:hypothetical protein
MLLHSPNFRESQTAKLTLKLLLVCFLALYTLMDMFDVGCHIVFVQESFSTNLTLEKKSKSVLKLTQELLKWKLASKFLSPV